MPHKKSSHPPVSVWVFLSRKHKAKSQNENTKRNHKTKIQSEITKRKHKTIRISWNVNGVSVHMGSGGLRGQQMGATAPFTMKIQLWRPLFANRSAPYRDANQRKCTLFSVISSECGETYKLRCYSVEKPENLLEKRPKTFARLRCAHFPLCL